MRRNLIVITGLLIVLCPLIVYTQAAKPGPELQKLSGFVGAWSEEGEYKSGNGYGVPAGKVTQVERYQWLPGGFFLQMNRDGKGPEGEIKHMLIFGYDVETKKYTLAFVNLAAGVSGSYTGSNNGNTWTWSGNGHTPDGKRFQERCGVTLVPNTSYTLRCDTSSDGKTWSPSFEGKATKAKS